MLSESKYTHTTFSGVEYTNEYDLDETFLYDLYNLAKKDFILKYKEKYNYLTETPLKEEYVNGYINMKNKEYYIVPSKGRWDYRNDRKGIFVKVGYLEWNEYLNLDGRNILKINQGMSKEHFIYSMVSYTSMNYDDLENMKEEWLIDRCIEIYNYYQVNDHVERKEMMFKIDMSYWKEKGYTNPLVISSIIKRIIKNDDFSKYYNEELTIEENIIVMKNHGIKTKKDKLKKWCIYNDVYYITNAEKKRIERNKVIIKVYNEDRNRSLREIEKIVNDNGYNVSYRTILSVLDEYNKSDKQIFNYILNDFIIEEVNELPTKYYKSKEVLSTERSVVDNTLVERSETIIYQYKVSNKSIVKKKSL